MGTFGPIHWLVVAVIVLLLFGGRGRVSDFMGDFAKGIKSFKKGLQDHDDEPPPPPRTLSAERRASEPQHQDETKEKAGH